MNSGGGMKAGTAMAGFMAVCCGLRLVALPLLASGALAGVACAFTGQGALALGGMLILAGTVVLLRQWRRGAPGIAEL